MIVLISISIVLLAYSNAFIAFDCSANPPTHAEVSLIDTRPCVKHNKNITHYEKKIQLLQPKIFEDIEYFQCLIEIKHLIFRCGKTIDTMHKQAIRTEVYNLDKIECKRLVKTGKFNYDKISIQINKDLNINYFTTETFGSISDGTCYPGSYSEPLVVNGISYDRAVRISEFKVLTKISMATVDIEEKKIILDNGLRCEYNKFYCFSANEGTVYWEPYFEQPSCIKGKEYIVIFEGYATEVKEYTKLYPEPRISYLIHYNDYDFQILSLNKIARICGQKTLLTEHPNLAIIEGTDIGFTLPYEPKKLGKNVNLMTYVNSKLMYIMKHTKDQIDDLYEKLSYDRCLAETKITQNMLTIASLFPTYFAYQYFGEAGHTAVTRGEVIYFIQCKAISVNFTTTPPTPCFNEIPVMYNDKQFFVQPRLRIITNIGTQVDCSSILNVKYKFNNMWFIVTPQGLIPSVDPDTLKITDHEPWKFKEIEKLAETGIYSKTELDKVNKIIMSPIQTNPLTVNIQRSISGQGTLPEGMKITNMFSPEEFTSFVSKTAESAWDKIVSHFQIFGNFFSVLLGIVIIIRFVKFFLNIVVNSFMLYRGVGCNWRLLFFWWENIVHHFLRENNDKNLTTGKQKKKIKSQEFTLVSDLQTV